MSDGWSGITSRMSHSLGFKYSCGTQETEYMSSEKGWTEFIDFMREKIR